MTSQEGIGANYETSHYLKKAGAVCMAAAMMTGCASGSSVQMVKH